MPLNIDEFLAQRHAVFARQLGMSPQHKSEGRSRHWWWVGFLILATLAVGVALLVLLQAPRSFPTETRIRIESGTPLNEIADLLSENNIVRSGSIFELWASFTGKASSLQAGDYIFSEPLSTHGVMKRIATGEHGDVSIRLTILEGATLNDIGKAAARVLDDFDVDKFIDQAIDFNGYLFPDTYFVLPGTTEEELIEQMHDRFSSVFNEIGSNVLNTIEPEELRDIVIMASIIEREALGVNDAYTISGILWKRIEIGMPLQVDASFAYLFDKASSEVTRSDLDFDSPYNTYKYTGLPPSALGNPGKISLDAALHPADSPYLFYLHDMQGNVHYGRNHDEHVNNKNKYLR